MVEERFDILMLLDNPLISDQRVEKEARSMAKAGLKILILASAEDSAKPQQEDRDGYRILRVLEPFFKHPLRFGYKRKLRETVDFVLRFNFTVLHCHDFQLLPVAAGVKANKPGIPLVYDSHEYLHGWPYYKEIPTLFNRIKGFFVWKRFLQQERAAAQSINALICPSNAIGMLQKLRFDSSLSPLIIRNIPEDQEVLHIQDLRTELHLPPEVHIIVHAGNIHQSDEDVDRLVRAVKSRTNCHLLFIGNRPRYYAVKERLSVSVEAKGFVHFLEYDPIVLHGILQQCTVGVAATETRYLAHRVGSSNRIMEYTKAGIPVIATRQESHEEMSETFGHIALYHSNDGASIQAAIQAVLSDRAGYMRRAKAASGQLSWNREIQPLIDLYSKISQQHLIQNSSK
ncbi:MAG: glycosyltransferase family 4 protein [Cryomorphaceae bacterium]